MDAVISPDEVSAEAPTPGRVATALGGGALLVYAMARPSLGGLALAAVGGGLVLRALGLAPRGTAGLEKWSRRSRPIRAEAIITIDRPVAELFASWRDLGRLPTMLEHVERVETLGEGRTRWTVCGPGGARVSWDAEELDTVQDRHIEWRSLPGSDVEVSGRVTFEPAPGDRGTEVRVRLAYGPPGGALTGIVAALLGAEPGQTLRSDLRRFKQLVEAGEIATTDGQPAGSPQPIEKGSITQRLAEAVRVPSRRAPAANTRGQERST